MDLSKLSDDDLSAIASGDMSKVSDKGLNYIIGQEKFEKELKSVKADTGFTGAFGAGKERLKGDIAALAGRVGIMDTDTAEQYKTQKEQLAERMFKPTQEGWSEAPFTKFKETLGGSLPYTALPLAAGLGAAALPTAVAATPVLGGLTTLGTVIGAGGAGLASLGQFTGSNISRQMQEDPNLRLKDTNLMAAGAAAIPQAALDVVSLRMIPGIGKLFGAAGKEITPELAKRIAEQGILKTAGYYGLEGVKLAGKEGATEAGQQFFERLQAGLNIADEQARSEYFDNFIGGAVLGGALSVPGVAVERKQILSEGARLEEEAKQKDILERQKAQREAALAEKKQLEQTAENLGVPSSLALPAPETRLEPLEDMVDPLVDPLGRFKSTDLSAKEVAEVNKRRKEMGKPRIGRTFSIEDLADVFKPEEATAAEGVLGRLIAARTNFAGEDIPAQTIELAAQQRGLDTKTQGFKDFLTRVTGFDNLQNMSAPQRYAVAQAIKNLQAGEETRILESGITNAKHYTPDQYNDALKGLSKEFKEMGNQENGRSSVLKLIEKYSGLKQEKDQQRILDEAVRNGDLERNVKASSTGNTIETFKPATDITPLPGGMDIRKETFKQGEEPEAYEVRAGSRVISTAETAEDADKNAAVYEQHRQQEIVNLEKQIRKLQADIAKRDAELTNDQALGNDQDNAFFVKSANYYGQNQVAQASIADLRQQQQAFAEPVRVQPLGMKPIAKESYTFYEKDQPQVKFDTEEDAEKYGISRLDNKTLQQIIDSAPAQKQTGRVKRYADLAQKELNERQSIESERGIAVTTTKGLKGGKERLEKLGIYTKEVHDNLENLRQTLLPALKRFGLERVALRVLNSIEDGKADGFYIQEIMGIALDSKNPMGTLRHESIHALKELGAFTPQEWKVLENKAKSEWVQKYIKDAKLYDSYKEQYMADHGNLIGFEPYIQEEAIAEAFKHYKVGSLPPGLVGNIWVRLNKMFEALRNYFNKLGFTTADDIFTKVEEGKKQPTKQAVSEKVKFSKTEQNAVQNFIDKVYADTPVSPFNPDQHAFVYDNGDSGVFFELKPSTSVKDAVEVYWFNSFPQRSGVGTKGMKQLQDLAAKDGLSLTLMPWDKGRVSKAALTKFYKKSGFEPLRKGSSTMVWNPEKAEPKFALRETEQFPKNAVENNNWKATPIARRMAEDYAVENGITPYVSEGQISVPVEPVKYSIKPPSDDPSKNDPTTGLPLNKNGSVTLYYPTTAEEARRINNEKKISPSNPDLSAIYLTNESSGWKSLGRMGDEYQVTDGSVVRVEIDPSLLQLAEEYEDGRKEFYVPIKEGEYFNKKMRMWAMYAERSKPIPLATKYSELGTAFERSLNAFKQLNEAEKRARTKEVKQILKRDHNIGKLLGENGKLEKTRVGDYGITYDDKSVASLGLGLASAQKLNDKTSTCPVSAICEGLCLGDTSGNNMMYGGMASGELAKSLEKTSFRAGPRLSQYLKTEAMMVHPEEFVLLLDKEIKAFKRWADKNEYLPAIRLNVTSDIPAKYLKPIMDANPEVIFYDYTKLDSAPVADNHHLTYSSTGVSQIVGNERIINKEQNWDRMKRLLDKGSNVAMAFTSKTDMPSVVVDEASGKEYQVWNGDNYDARFLDPKRDDGVGMIVGLTNKAATLKAPTAAKETNGFFIDYDKARDGDRVVIADQSKFAGSKVIPITKIATEPKKFALRAPETEEFKQWFGDSKIVNADGSPKVMYHGTLSDVAEFKPKTANAIFVTPDVDSANRFATNFKKRKDAQSNIIPVYVKAENVFDYENLENIDRVLDSLSSKDKYELLAKHNFKFTENFKRAISKGTWKYIESPAFQNAIKDAGFDSFYVKEADIKNLGVYSPNQIKSVFNQKPTESADIRFSLRAPETKEFKQWFGDSKVVNEDGSPKVVYHGTDRPDFSIFDPASWFSENPFESSAYAKTDVLKSREKSKTRFTLSDDTSMVGETVPYAGILSDHYDPKVGEYYGTDDGVYKYLGKGQWEALSKVDVDYDATTPDFQNIKLKKVDSSAAVERVNKYIRDYATGTEGEGGRVYPVYISIKNPLYLSALEANRFSERTGMTKQDIQDQVNKWKAQGYDGIITKSDEATMSVDVRNALGGIPEQYIPFDSNQVKSAFNQKPTKSPDIRYALREFNMSDLPESGNYTLKAGTEIFHGAHKARAEEIEKSGKTLLLPSKVKQKSGGGNLYEGNLIWFGDRDLAEGHSKSEVDVMKARYDAEDGITREAGKAFSTIADRDYNLLNIWNYKFTQDEADKVSDALGLPDYKRVGEGDTPYNAAYRAHTNGKNVNRYYVERSGEFSDGLAMTAKALGYDGVFDQSGIAFTADNGIRLGEEGAPMQRFSLRSQLSDRLNERIGETTTRRKEAGFVERMMDAISPTAVTRLRQAFINKYESIEQLSRLRGEKMGGDQLLAENSAIAAALQSDRAAGVAAASFRDGIPVFDKGYTYVSDMDGKVKGLIPILEPLMKYKDPYIFQTFQYYAGTRRGRRLDAEGREKTFTKEDIAYGKELEAQFPEFATVFDEYQKYNQGLVKYMMDTGVISAQEAKVWTENWDYIPFYRQLDGEKTAGPKVFSPIAGVAKPKKLKGSEAPLDDFMETVVRNARAAIEAGMKNEAGRRVIRDVVDFGLGERLPSSQSGADIVTVKENGMTVYYRVDDPLLVESLKGLNLPQLPFMDFLSAPANLLRNFVTKDPGFIIANLGRDSMQAWITSGTDMKPLTDSFKQFGKELLNQSPEAYALAKSGLTGYDFAGDVASTAKQVEKELRKRSGTRTVKEQALLPLTAFWDMLEKGSHASDMATRAEVYKRTLERTGSEAEAFFQAMEVMNFSRKGNSALVRILSAMIPFFNARVQGLDVLYRTGFGKTAMENKEKIQKAFIFRSLVLLGSSIMYWAMVSDDDEYKKLSKEERDNYWIIPAIKINDKPFRFPIPFELGVLFKVLPERALEYSFGTDTGKDLRESLLRNAMSTLSFNPIPQAALPVVENITNHSFFTGEPIVGRGVEGLAPQFQFGAGTSEIAKKLGKELNYSPQKIDNLIRGYTGTMGTYAMMMLDAAFTQEGDPVKATKRMEQLPVIKRFFAGDMGNISAYYELKEEVDTVVQTVNTLQRTGNSEDLKLYLEENKKLYALKNYVGTLDKTMKQLNQAGKLINASKTMTADEKREALDKIHEAQLRLTSRIKILRKGYE